MRIFSALTFLLLALTLASQEIEIKIIESEPYYEGQHINIEICLINTTDTSLTYFDSRGPIWDECFKEKWELSRDYQMVEVLPLNNSFDYKFTDSTFLTLQKGDTNIIRTKAIHLEYEGDYSLTYTQEQSNKFVQKQHADSLVNDSLIFLIKPFMVTTNVQFKVHKQYDTTLHEIIDMSWDEWKDYRHTKVYTRENFYDNIHAALKKPQNVYKLLMYCQGMSAEEIVRIARLKNLKSLTLNNYELNYFPEELTRLNLYELTILPKDDQIIKFENGFSKNQTIRELRVKFMGGMSDSLCNLKYLEKLDISDSNIGELAGLDLLKNLKELTANNAQISSVENTGFSELTGLKSLNLSGNKAIKEITPLLNCLSLEFLVINRTGISEIPHEIENLGKLKKLAVSNKLTVISDSLGNLSDMRYLSFGGNRSLDSIPSSILKMKKLLHLDVSSTKIPMLPEGISELSLEKVLIYNTECAATKDYKALRKRLGAAFKE